MLQPSMRRLERRVDFRYRFDQPLRSSFVQRGSACLGAGHTVELGAGGVLFLAECPPPDGSKVELQLTWPFLVQDVCAVVLVIQGTVVRNDPRGTAVRMQHFSFQTAESRAWEAAIHSGAACNLIG